MVNLTEINKMNEKQLAYENRAFLRMYFKPDGSCLHYTVSKEGAVYQFDNLNDAINKFNEVCG